MIPYTLKAAFTLTRLSPTPSMSMGYSKHKFECIPVAAIHINTSLEYEQVTCKLYIISK